MTVSVVSSCSATDSVSSLVAAASDSSVTADCDSDGEVSRIDFRGVNLRSKKKREGSCGPCDDNSDSSHHQQPERPMSWEGELSDQEMSSNTITNQVK